MCTVISRGTLEAVRMQRDRSIGSRGEGGDRVALLQQLATCMNRIRLFSTCEDVTRNKRII
jgi:hypothetical protein